MHCKYYKVMTSSWADNLLWVNNYYFRGKTLSQTSCEKRSGLCASTSDNLSSSWVSLQSTEQDFRLVCAVYTWLDHLLEHSIHWPWSKVVRQMLHLLPVQVGTAVSMLIHIHTHWNDTMRNTEPKLDLPNDSFKSVRNTEKANYRAQASINPHLLKPQRWDWEGLLVEPGCWVAELSFGESWAFSEKKHISDTLTHRMQQ